MESVVIGNSLVITVDRHQQGLRLGDWLRAQLRLPNNYLSSRFRGGHVMVGNKVTQEDHVLVPGQRVRLVGEIDEPYGVDHWQSSTGSDSLAVLYEDDHMLVVNKPAGILIYPGTSDDVDTLAHRVAAYYAGQGLMRKVRHVHRLDKDTTGAVLYAKHAYSARTLDDLLANHQIVRTYVAVVQGRLQPPSGMVEASLGRDRHVSGKFRVSAGGKPAKTHYRTLMVARAGGQSVSLIACVLETGRTHQIRVHMEHLGAPVVGDTLYAAGHGLRRAPWTKGYALHAAVLAFSNPYAEARVVAQAPVPDTFEAGMLALGFAPSWVTEMEKTAQWGQEITRQQEMMD